MKIERWLKKKTFPFLKDLRKSAMCFTLVTCQCSTFGKTESCVSSWHLQCMSAEAGSKGSGAFPLYCRIAEVHRCWHVMWVKYCPISRKIGIDLGFPSSQFLSEFTKKVMVPANFKDSAVQHNPPCAARQQLVVKLILIRFNKSRAHISLNAVRGTYSTLQ